MNVNVFRIEFEGSLGGLESVVEFPLSQSDFCEGQVCVVGVREFFEELFQFLCSMFVFPKGEVECRLFYAISDLVRCHVGDDTMDMLGWVKVVL